MLKKLKDPYIFLNQTSEVYVYVLLDEAEGSKTHIAYDDA